MAVALDGNNPGGINNGSYAKSQPGYIGANGRYASFATLQDGFNAEVNLLQHSYLEAGYNTPASIAARYAPSADGNNTAAYAQQIASGMGIGLNDTISPDQAAKLALVQSHIENGAFDPGSVTINGAPGSLSSSTSGTATTTPTAPAVTFGDVLSGKATMAQYAASVSGVTGMFAAFDAAAKNMAIRGGAVALALVLIAFGLYYLADRNGAVTETIKAGAMAVA